MVKSDRWVGSWAKRGGVMRDRWGNIKKVPVTYRNRAKGYVVTEQGTFLGIEPTKRHHYSRDETKVKRPKGWHGESLRHAIAAQKGKR